MLTARTNSGVGHRKQSLVRYGPVAAGATDGADGTWLQGVEGAFNGERHPAGVAVFGLWKLARGGHGSLQHEITDFGGGAGVEEAAPRQMQVAD